MTPRCARWGPRWRCRPPRLAGRSSSAAAVMITGSHNPPEDNVFKLVVGTETLHGAAIAALRDRVQQLIAEPAPHPIKAMYSRDVIGAYLDHAHAMLQLGPRRPRV